MSYEILTRDEESGEWRPLTAEEESERRRRFREIVGSREDCAALNRYEKSMGL